jgi:hypothetical protein
MVFTKKLLYLFKLVFGPQSVEGNVCFLVQETEDSRFGKGRSTLCFGVHTLQ